MKESRNHDKHDAINNKSHTCPGNALDNAFSAGFCNHIISLDKVSESELESTAFDPPSMPPQFTINRPPGINLSFNSNQVLTCQRQIVRNVNHNASMMPKG